MPSSSTHTTRSETRLLHLYISTYRQLYHTDSSAAYYVTRHFSSLLELPMSDIIERATADQKLWWEWKVYLRKHEKSEALYSVSFLLGDVSRELMARGRKGEARVWKGLALEVVEMAGGEAEREEEGRRWRRVGG
ncbi:uncharacterized protein MYCGRDRAFT_95348 [Zymoseptoria tritici IPO323]|uniref:Uncharacterized protein n=1 Tax=Zymoseptoria tritici (strain CBS 115943 / IPO323) TaxID=336722 RepID=F9XIP9_ZYMTI|nr:uncharacterized protein MYCGRDRAFT_95348 [Zymoseptoria tritici IPO323]EGP85251.1 hypothetical protein MYCGRDRAFT_95348 [Zymoseptoria tritici IPO323]